MNHKKVTLFLLGALTVFGTIVFGLIYFRDMHNVVLERLNPNTVVTSDLSKLAYMNSILPNAPHAFTRKHKGEHECLNGKDPSSMDSKEQLLEFIKGPCLPVLAVPGLLSSRLKVTIDCEELKEHSPEVFEACGWSSCSNWHFWRSKPKQEYDLWIGSLFGPLSIIFQSSVKCWGSMIQLNYDETASEISAKYVTPKGANITVYGQTETENSNCGFDAINNILPGPVQTSYTTGFSGIKNALEGMGYQTGLTLYAAPYDWRKTTTANGVTRVLNDTIRQIYELTGKPTVIMAHSMGNFGTLHLLNSLSHEEKEKYVAHYVSIANPLAGSPKTLKSFIGGDKDYVYKKLGINFQAQRMLIKASSGAFDLMPKNIYTTYSDSSWLKDWKTRTDLENNLNISSPEGRNAWEKIVEKGNHTYKWFPTPLLNCTSEPFKDRRAECGLFMYNWSTTPIVKIKNEVFTASETDIKKLFNNYISTTNISEKLFRDSQTNNIHLITNPEVPVSVVYASHLNTDKTYVWNYDPRENANKGEFAFSSSVEYTPGDRTVPTASALLPALKWSWEFENKQESGISNAKPIKTVEMCSLQNNKEDAYDIKSEDGPYKVNTNEYIGLDCDCFTDSGNGWVFKRSCDHADILNDSKFHKYIGNIVNANYKVEDHTNILVNKMSNKDLHSISNSCPGVHVKSTKFEEFKRSL